MKERAEARLTDRQVKTEAEIAHPSSFILHPSSFIPHHLPRGLQRGSSFILFIILAAFVLRTYRLDFVSLRGDEAFTVLFVQRTWEGLWKGIRLVEPNPPLMYLALRAWVALAGAGEFATRYFSVFFGVLCVPLVYRLAQEIFTLGNQFRNQVSQGPEAARNPVSELAPLLAAVLIAINPYQIWHSQDVRNYTLWPALSLLSLIFFWRWWKEQKAETRKQKAAEEKSEVPARSFILHPSSFILRASSFILHPSSFILYIFATTASLYTHYYDTFILVAVNLFVLLTLWRQWRSLARWFIAQAVLAAVYLPWVLFFTNRVTTYGEPSAQQSTSLLDIFSRTLATFVAGDTVPEMIKAILWLPLAVALAIVLIYLARRSASRALFLLLYIAVPTLALFAISINRPLFLERYLNAIAPAYYLAFAVGIAALASWRPSARDQQASTAPARQPSSPAPRHLPRILSGAQAESKDQRGAPPLPRPSAPLLSSSFALLALAFFVALSSYSLFNYYADPVYAKAPDWRSLAKFIAARQQPGDIIVQNFTEMSAIYYLSGSTPVITVPKDFWPAPADEETLRAVIDKYQRIWLIPAAPDFWDPDHFVENYLSRYSDRQIDTRISSFRLQLYATPHVFESGIIPVNAQIGSVTLVGYRLQGLAKGTMTTAGPLSLHLVLYWRPNGKIEKDQTVFVHLAGTDDRVLAQRDSAPVGGTYPTTQWRPGELIVDSYDLSADLGPGSYTLLTGMYDPTTLTRVPAVDAKKKPLPADRVPLTVINVVP